MIQTSAATNTGSQDAPVKPLPQTQAGQGEAHQDEPSDQEFG